MFLGDHVLGPTLSRLQLLSDEFPNGMRVRGLAEISDFSDISHIQATIYLENRRHNHFRYRPEYDVIDSAKEAVQWIRNQLNCQHGRGGNG